MAGNGPLPGGFLSNPCGIVSIRQASSATARLVTLAGLARAPSWNRQKQAGDRSGGAAFVFRRARAMGYPSVARLWPPMQSIIPVIRFPSLRQASDNGRVRITGKRGELD